MAGLARGLLLAMITTKGHGPHQSSTRQHRPRSLQFTPARHDTRCNPCPRGTTPTAVTILLFQPGVRTFQQRGRLEFRLVASALLPSLPLPPPSPPTPYSTPRVRSRPPAPTLPSHTPGTHCSWHWGRRHRRATLYREIREREFFSFSFLLGW